MIKIILARFFLIFSIVSVIMLFYRVPFCFH